MSVRVTYRLRYYPTASQEQKLRACFDAKLLAWNLCLRFMEDEWRQKGRFVTAYDAQKQLTTERKSRPVLQARPVDPMLQAINDLGTAWRNFRSGRAKWPKEKRYVRSARYLFISPRYTPGSVLTLPVIGDIGGRIVWSRIPTGRPKMVTVSEDAAGRWHASFAVEEERAALPATGSSVGIDLGVREVVCASTAGERRVPMPRYFRKYLAKKRRLNRSVSRKVKGSNRRAKARARLARLECKIADSRRDWTHKLTADIVRTHDAITVEDLVTRPMARLRSLAVSVSDAAMREVRRQLEYKAAWYGRTVTVADRFYPSSKLCSDCGARNDFPLKVRTWACVGCGIEHDRDSNAARNLLNYPREAGTISAWSRNNPDPVRGRPAKKREPMAVSH